MTEITTDSDRARDYAAAVLAVHGWLDKLHSAFERWQEQQGTDDSVPDLWQDVLQWYTAFDLSFAQLAQYIDDVTDASDAQLALALANKSILRDRIRMLPMANQRLRALPPQLQEHLLSIHLPRLYTQEPLLDAERVTGMNDVYRIRVHGFRVVYHLADQGPLILSVTAEHWRNPPSEKPGNRIQVSGSSSKDSEAS